MSNLNKKKISKILDIGLSFLFLDSAKIFKKKNCAVGLYKIKSSHWTFASHLLKDPIFPGVLLIEITTSSTRSNHCRFVGKVVRHLCLLFVEAVLVNTGLS